MATDEMHHYTLMKTRLKGCQKEYISLYNSTKMQALSKAVSLLITSSYGMFVINYAQETGRNIYIQGVRDREELVQFARFAVSEYRTMQLDMMERICSRGEEPGDILFNLYQLHGYVYPILKELKKAV